jgi:hypothetical protein
MISYKSETFKAICAFYQADAAVGPPYIYTSAVCILSSKIHVKIPK